MTLPKKFVPKANTLEWLDETPNDIAYMWHLEKVTWNMSIQELVGCIGHTHTQKNSFIDRNIDLDIDIL